MAIKVHGVPVSTCTAGVLLCLNEKGLDYELLLVDLAAKAHKQQPYLSLNPFGQIPALEDGEVSLFESRAINRYLACKHKDIGTDLLRANSLAESAVVETWMEVEAHQFHGPATAILHQMIVNPMYGIACNEQTIETEMEKLGKVLDVYEERLSKCKYLAGENYSLADLQHIPSLVYFMKTTKANAVTSRPHVSAWWNDISSRPATVNVSANMKL
ncbi:glutathione S-transferase F13-like [Alnus glutinosa]|uniref:glutathione S-transferase F13-like n=1 Tax=Alnus glutinosa TaxID=3517 RepID=UPI002D78FE6E|nr:glutathione S-transferase F13-like [Alnus glutinosa]